MYFGVRPFMTACMVVGRCKYLKILVFGLLADFHFYEHLAELYNLLS